MQNYYDQIEKLDGLGLDSDQYAEVTHIISNLCAENERLNDALKTGLSIVERAETYKNGCESVEKFLKETVNKQK